MIDKFWQVKPSCFDYVFKEEGVDKSKIKENNGVYTIEGRQPRYFMKYFNGIAMHLTKAEFEEIKDIDWVIAHSESKIYGIFRWEARDKIDYNIKVDGEPLLPRQVQEETTTEIPFKDEIKLLKEQMKEVLEILRNSGIVLSSIPINKRTKTIQDKFYEIYRKEGKEFIDGISFKSTIIQQLGISVPTFYSYIKQFERDGLLSINYQGRTPFYKFKYDQGGEGDQNTIENQGGKTGNDVQPI